LNLESVGCKFLFCSIELILVILQQGRKELAEKFIKEGKLSPSEELVRFVAYFVFFVIREILFVRMIEI
jgi:hypothetical protein